MNIEKLLENKTNREKAQLKSKELARIEIAEKFIKDNIEIEIIGKIKEININGQGGIELFAKAWKDGKQLGFGKDGTVEIERFRFFNPPVLVDDPNGDIVREWSSEHPETGEITYHRRTLREDPEAATLQSLGQTILQVAKFSDENIVAGKVGNTTSTFYSGTGDGRVERRDAPCSNVYTGAGSTTDPTATSSRLITWYDYVSMYNSRIFLPIDTSALGASENIDSATLSVYQTANGSTSNNRSNVVVVATTQASTATLATSDYNSVGSTAGCTAVDIGTGTSNNNSFRNFVLNSTGLGFINKTGVSKLGLRSVYDINGTCIVTTANGLNVTFSMADETGTTNDPKLVVEHSEASTSNFFQFF